MPTTKWLVIRILKTITIIIATIATTLLDMNTDGELATPQAQIRIGLTIVIAIALSEFLELCIAYFETEETNSRIKELNIQRALAAFIQYVMNNHETRACILLHDKRKEILYIYTYWGKFKPEELKLTFKKSQGLSGYLFWDHPELVIKYVDYDKLTETELQERWRMDANQIEHTKHIQSMLAVLIPRNPELRPYHENIDPIGVLVFDSPLSAQTSKLEEITDKLGDRATEVAQLISVYF